MPVIGGYDPTDKDNNGNEKTKWVTVTEFVSGVVKRKALDMVLRDGEGQIADPLTKDDLLDDEGNLKALISNAYDSEQNAFIISNNFYEDQIFANVAVAAGIETGAIIPVQGFKTVVVIAEGDQSFDMYSYPSPDGSLILTKETLASGIAANGSKCVNVTQLAPYLQINIKNTSTSSGNYSLWVYAI
jgi:hypothetical protein